MPRYKEKSWKDGLEKANKNEAYPSHTCCSIQETLALYYVMRWLKCSLALFLGVVGTALKDRFLPHVNNKDAEQPAHQRSPISVFVICCLDSIIPSFSMSKISSL